ncbi:uroplakin-3b-like protein 1 [Gorilla gorilla gorilla]|uniref:uroplakin-3b-like protein 1 n=1 Tax=Gorilla gorilla gorilla TaxID=9595 RepID=UPI00300A918D
MDNSWRLGPAIGLSAGQSQLLVSLLLLLTCVQPGTDVAAPEHISYVPQLSNDTLAGRLTLSTFTLEQPLGQFSSHNISDLDTIWLVVALSNATQSFTAPRTNQDIPAPANFSQRGYYLTLRANRALYQARGQLHVLRVGNDTHCQPTKIGCNHPLPGPGPYRVKFLVMNDEGPVAETKWSSDTRLQQAAPEHISYVPQLSNDTLAGRLTLSTFTLEQPLGQFSSHNISDLDTIWLVVALSNATQSFTAPRTNQDIPAPANFSQRGYYLTLRANRALYQARGQLHVLRVGNDTHCQPTKIGCNHPLPGPGPYRVKFLVMNDEGPVAETKWSSDTCLQQGIQH